MKGNASVGIVFVATLALLAPLDADAQIVIFSIEFNQVTFQADHAGTVPCSEYGEIVLTVEPDPGDEHYVQIGAEIASLATPAWVARNLVILPGPDDGPSLLDTGMGIDLTQLGVTRFDCRDGETVNFEIVITPEPVSTAPTFTFSESVTMGMVIDNAEGDIPPGAIASPSLAPSSTPGAFTFDFGALTFVGRPAMPNVQQGNNECCPGAVANSMHWMDDIGVIDLGAETLLQSHEKLKLDMLPGGWDGIGVSQSETVEGKLRFAAEAGLGLDIHYQADAGLTDLGESVSVTHNSETSTANRDGAGGKPTFQYLLQEMLNGQDVELSIDWLDASGDKTGGHCVTVTGAIQFGNYRAITFSDDAKQDDDAATTLRTNRVAIIEDEGGYIKLGGITRNRVKAIYSESPLPIPTLNEWALIVFVIILVTAGLFMLGRRRATQGSS